MRKIGSITPKVCLNCGIVFEKNYKLSKKQWEKRKFCSTKCDKNSPMQKQKRSLKVSSKYQGSGNPGWKGGVTPVNKIEREKFKRLIQKQVLERDDYTYQICGQRGGELHVDHIQPFAEYVERRFDMENCRTLCRKCHYLITYHREMPLDSLWGLN